MSSYNQEFTEQDQAILDHVFEEIRREFLVLAISGSNRFEFKIIIFVYSALLLCLSHFII